MGKIERNKDCCTVEVLKKHECYGCTACDNICPKDAIKMEYDIEGFKYPVIDKYNCIECGLCQKICPSINSKSSTSINKCYAAFNKNTEARLTSSSGGIFDILSKYVLSQGGLVVGAAFDKNNNLSHIMIDDIKDLEKLKGSKYLQSNLNEVFNTIKSNIKDKKILFVGTPCQVSGLKSFLRKDFDNLYCCDVVCHGVPSSKVFKKYISELEVNNGRVINGVNFRDKKEGWENYHISIKQEKNNYYINHHKDLYMKLFLSDICLRPSCYSCDFKLGNKYSDITLGDFWGINNYYPELNDKKGTSAIVVNTKKGDFLFDAIKDNLVYKECDINHILSGNPSLKYSSKIPDKREEFFIDLENGFTIKQLANKYIPKVSILRRIIRKSKVIIKKIIKK